MEKVTRKQVMARLDKIITGQSKGQLVCRTCGASSCCILDHDNLLPQRAGDKFEKDGKVKTYHGKKLPFQSASEKFEEHRGGFVDVES